jgi:DNA-binding NtrC family response regulator
MSEIDRWLNEVESPRVARGLRRAFDELVAERQRLTHLLARTVQLAAARGVLPVAEQVLDGVIDVLDAERGFIGLFDGRRDWHLVAARHLSKQDIDDAEGKVSSSLIEECRRTRRPVVEVDAVEGRFAERASVSALKLRSVIVLPIAEEGVMAPLGFVYLDDTRRRGVFDQAATEAAAGWLPTVASVVRRAVEDSSDDDEQPFSGVVTRSARLREELAELARVAAFDAPILLTGETGTGKSFIARKVHQASDRRDKAFVHVNCGAIPESLLEGELFGTTKGAFTGATEREGRFEAAHGGTLFLDELDAMPMACQVKLLVAIQERWVTRLGSNQRRDVDVRIIAAMNRDPFELIESQTLREDLYYRLAVILTRIPPLRERPEDIPLLAQSVLARSQARYGLPPVRLGEVALEQLLSHPWPGNVRELENTLDRAALTARGGVIEEVRLRARPASSPSGAAEPVAAPTAQPARKRRYKVTEEEFDAEWARHDGHAPSVAQALGVTERSVFRLKKRFGR